MAAQHLNLARKWRSKQFHNIVGQELSVRMLKNGLYLNQFFPVYLFSGQRGCGKTSTARVFAAALNCIELPHFQKDPKSFVVPCLQCDSCTAMGKGNHPDFIEIDAASHTGVDNVRTIIDAAALLPVMGNKKIYLIDEAHMLSKAAFNAFLKILEEPPESVIFMLATTDPQKIIDTVRSRCFQLFFNAIETEVLVKHVEQVCKEETIKVEKEALYTIVKETEGSARDALNLLEQVRFSHGAVTQESVLSALGHLSEEQLLGIFGCIVAKDKQKLVRYLQDIKFETYNAVSIWQKFQELVRTALYAKCGASNYSLIQNKERFEKVLRAVSQQQLGFYLQQLYEHEMVLLKTTVQHGLLEILFMSMCGKEEAPTITVAPQAQPITAVSAQKKTVQSVVQTSDAPVSQLTEDGSEKWAQFLQKIEGISDPLLNSIFKQSEFKQFDRKNSKLIVSFAKDVSFFGEWLKETEPIWMGFLKSVFGATIEFISEFKVKKKTDTALIKVKAGVSKDPSVEATGSPNRIVSPTMQRRATIVNVSDKEKWKTANELLEAFGGTIVEVQESEKAE